MRIHDNYSNPNQQITNLRQHIIPKTRQRELIGALVSEHVRGEGVRGAHVIRMLRHAPKTSITKLSAVLGLAFELPLLIICQQINIS